MDWELIKSVATGVFAVVVVIGGGVLGLVYSNQKTLRSSNQDLRDRVDDLEKERADDKLEIAGLSSKVNERDGEIGLLKSMVTGKVEWVAISDQLEEHHRQALAYWRTADERMLGIDGHMVEIRDLLRERP